MDTQGERVELEDEVFAPSEDLVDLQAGEAFDADLTVARNALDASAGERLKLLGGEVQEVAA